MDQPGLNELESEIIRLIANCKGEGQALRRRNLVEMLDGVAEDRQIRRAIKHLVIEHGVPIASSPEGYFTPTTPEELDRACSFIRAYGMACLTAESRLRGCTVLELVGQMRMELGENPAQGARVTAQGEKA